MDFDLSPADLAFRDEFRTWLSDNKPPDIDVASDFKEAETLLLKAAAVGLGGLGPP